MPVTVEATHATVYVVTSHVPYYCAACRGPTYSHGVYASMAGARSAAARVHRAMRRDGETARREYVQITPTPVAP